LPQGLVQAAFFSSPADPPYVVTGHNADVYGNGALTTRLQGLALRRAAAITVVSEHLRDFLAARFQPWLDGTTIRVLPMGVATEAFRPRYRDDGWAERNHLTRPVILFVGRLAADRGIDHLLRAMAQAPLAGSGATLVLVGEGPERARMEAMVAALGIACRVRFLGDLSRDKLRLVAASADIACAPPTVSARGVREGLPTVLLEAAASGLPLVATRVGGIPEFVKDGAMGFVVPERDSTALGQALNRLAREPCPRARYG